METPTTQPTPASDPNPPAPAPAPTGGGEGGEGGTQAPAGFVSQSELDRAETARRDLQSKYDKLIAERRSATPAPTPTPANQGAAADTAAMLAEFERRTELREAKAEFRSDERFKGADPALFARATEFDSVEAFEASLLESVQSRTAERTALLSEVEAQVRAEYEAKYGKLEGTPPAGTGGGTPDGGAMTVERLTQLPQAQFESWVAANPAEYERLLSGATA